MLIIYFIATTTQTLSIVTKIYKDIKNKQGLGFQILWLCARVTSERNTTGHPLFVLNSDSINREYEKKYQFLRVKAKYTVS